MIDNMYEKATATYMLTIQIESVRTNTMTRFFFMLTPLNRLARVKVRVMYLHIVDMCARLCHMFLAF